MKRIWSVHTLHMHRIKATILYIYTMFVAPQFHNTKFFWAQQHASFAREDKIWRCQWDCGVKWKGLFSPRGIPNKTSQARRRRHRGERGRQVTRLMLCFTRATVWSPCTALRSSRRRRRGVTRSLASTSHFTQTAARVRVYSEWKGEVLVTSRARTNRQTKPEKLIIINM